MTVEIKITSRGDPELRSEHNYSLHAGSVGWDRCGVAFNPSGDVQIERMKLICAAAMQEMGAYEASPNPDMRRCMETAMSHLEAAQMFAVKGLVMGK